VSRNKLRGGPKTRPLRLTAHIFEMSETICMIFGKLQSRFIPNTAVNPILINFTKRWRHLVKENNCVFLITLLAFYGKRKVTVWRPSICLSLRYTYHNSPGGSMRRGQRTYQLNNKEDRHTC